MWETLRVRVPFPTFVLIFMSFINLLGKSLVNKGEALLMKQYAKNGVPKIITTTKTFNT